MARIDGLRHEGRHFMQAWRLYPLLQARGLMASNSRLTDEGGSCGINGVQILVLDKESARIDAKARGKRFAHRVFAVCDCGRNVPFGKLGQHRKVCKANVFGGE